MTVVSFIGNLDLEENSSSQMTSSNNSVECIDSLPAEKPESFTIPVNLTLLSQELSKFWRCVLDEEFDWTYGLAKGSNTFSEWRMGEEMLPMQDMLIEGRAFITFEYGGRLVKKMVKAHRNVKGLQLDNLTVNELVERYLAVIRYTVDCESNKLCANAVYTTFSP